MCQNSLLAMLMTHASCFALQLLQSLSLEFRKDWILFPMLIDILTVVLYQGAIFYIQIVYLNMDKEDRMDNAINLAENWLLVELITYYAQIIQAMLFMLYSSVIRPVKPSKAMRKILTKGRHHDYLTST